MRRRQLVSASLLLLGAGLLAGCGQKGALFLPSTKPVTPAPTASASPPAPPSSAMSPATPMAPSAPAASAASPVAARSG